MRFKVGDEVTDGTDEYITITGFRKGSEYTIKNIIHQYKDSYIIAYVDKYFHLTDTSIIDRILNKYQDEV